MDDEAPIADTLAYIVEEAGYQALVAQNGQAAFTLAQQRWPAVVFTDQMMPGVNGTQLIAALQQHAQTENLPMPRIVLMTAANPPHISNTGAGLVLRKPFDIVQIEEILRGFFAPKPEDEVPEEGG